MSSLQASTAVAIPKRGKARSVQGQYIPGLCDRAVFRSMMDEANDALRDLTGDYDAKFGFTGAFGMPDGSRRAFFQIVGDAAPYSILVTPRHERALSFVKV